MVAMAVGAGLGAASVAAGVGIGIAQAAGAPIPAMIRCLDPTALGLVLFDFNPDQITMSRRPQGGNRPKHQGGSTGYILAQSDPATLALKGIVFTGETTKLRVDTLLAWVGPPSGLATMISALAGIPISSTPPVVTFQWGPPLLGFMYSVILTNVSATYTRFHSSGIPIRAELTLDMQVQPSLLGSIPTNPTSGGLPGRTTHLIREGESLHSVAQQRYGKPGAWRRIAEINGITDPRKVRPGTTIFLPGEGELRTAAS
jgi:nucleoid-associated protein YgaU